MPEINKKTDEELLEIVHRVEQADEEYLKGEKAENDAVQRNIDATRAKWINVSEEEVDQMIATNANLNSNSDGLWDEERCPNFRARLLHNRQVLKSNPDVINAMEERGRERLDQKRKQDIKAKRKLMGENGNPVKFK